MKQSGAVLLAAAFLLAGCGGRAAAAQTASSERMSEEHRESGSQAAQEQGKADTEKTERVKTGDDLQRMLTYYEGGTEVTMTVESLENGSYVEREVKITLGFKKDNVQ